MQNNDYSMQEALRLANSPAGRQLFQQLQQRDPAAVQQAIRSAAAGDYAQVQKLLTSLLSDPETQKLLQQLGGQS